MMRKKIIPIILAAALLLAGLGIYVSANRNRTQMQLMGQAYAEASGRTDDPVIAAFKGTEIRQSRIDCEKQIMTVMEGRTTAGDAQALNRRLRNLAMLEEAERRGLTVTQEEVNYELNGQRQLYADEEGVREMLDDYCENAGITIEQHFSMQEELMPHYILRQKLRDALGQEYCAQHGLEFTRVNPPQEMLDYLSRYLEGLPDTSRADITYYPGELSAEQIAWFNHDYFNLDGEAGVRNMMLSSTYQDVRDIDLYRLFYNGVPGTANDISKEERDALYALDTSAEHLDLIKVTPQQMDDVLQTYAGIGLAQTAMRGLDGMHYLERYDAYYMIHSDYLDARCKVLSGLRTEDGRLILRYQLCGGQYEVTLKPTETDFLFVSNVDTAAKDTAEAPDADFKTLLSSLEIAYPEGLYFEDASELTEAELYTSFQLFAHEADRLQCWNESAQAYCYPNELICATLDRYYEGYIYRIEDDPLYDPQYDAVVTTAIGGFGGGYSVDDLEIRSNGAEYTIKGTVRDGNGREIARKEYVLDAYDGGYTIRAIRPCAD